MQLASQKKIFLLLLTVVLSSPSLFAQITQAASISTYSIRKESVLDASQIVALSNAELTKSVVYVDGYGRAIESVLAGGSPNGKDIVSFAK